MCRAAVAPNNNYYLKWQGFFHTKIFTKLVILIEKKSTIDKYENDNGAVDLVRCVVCEHKKKKNIYLKYIKNRLHT